MDLQSGSSHRVSAWLPESCLATGPGGSLLLVAPQAPGCSVVHRGRVRQGFDQFPPNQRGCSPELLFSVLVPSAFPQDGTSLVSCPSKKEGRVGSLGHLYF